MRAIITNEEPVIRPYISHDRKELLDLLRMNTPTYFDPAEENDFVDYLEHHAQNYFVVEYSGAIVGGGGFNTGFDNGKTARISWDIIHPGFHGQRLGKKLTQHRIEKIRALQSINRIVVRTSQLAFKFYEKQGFQLERTVKDFWAPGFDLYEMALDPGSCK